MHPQIAQMIKTINDNTPALQAGHAPGGAMNDKLLALLDADPGHSKITYQQYAAGVELLVNLAHGDTGGSRTAAQVVLSAYNGQAFQLDITELSNLDAQHYAAALAVIRGRTELRIEPQEMIENGSRHFEQLWQEWEPYHCGNRHKLK